MNYSGEAAEQIVRLSLNGVEVAAKIGGKAAERLAVLLYAILRDQKKTRGKTRLVNMLRSGKELKVFAVKDNELVKFCGEARKYGVLYCILKDNKANDGLTDIMVRAEDAAKINRIYERFGLATIDMGTVKTAIERKQEVPMAKNGDDRPEPERAPEVDNKLDQFLNNVLQEAENPTAEKAEIENPNMAWIWKSPQSEHSSENRKDRFEGEAERQPGRPSVKKELEAIKAETGQQKERTEKEMEEDLKILLTPIAKKTDEKEVR